MNTMPHFDVGEAIPPNTAHAVSVSLPTWRSNIGYEEGESWVVDKMTTGYPRFFIHKSIAEFGRDIVARHGKAGQTALLFPTATVARRCLSFVNEHAPVSAAGDINCIWLVLDPEKPASPLLRGLSPNIFAVLCSAELFPVAKKYWQHTGDGVSSRRAEFCHGLLKEGLLIPVADGRPQSPADIHRKPCRGPRRYQRGSAGDLSALSGNHTSGVVDSLNGSDSQESSRFLEERFGRNLDLSMVCRAKLAIKRRIAGAMTAEVDLTKSIDPGMDSNSRGVASLQEDDIFLFPCGMNAIYNTHQALLRARGQLKSISFGFPYVDTLKILEKFGPGCVFYGHASAGELDELEGRLLRGERFLALFCEFPGNPLLTCPDLERIRRLADRHEFAVVVDETIGTFANINVLPFADAVVSSLTKIFSGDCNVMGGSAILNPNSRYYCVLKEAMRSVFEDTYWAEDVIFMERNSRDFMTRVERINTNAEAICEILKESPLVKSIYYPKYGASRRNYDVCRLLTGGYGGLLSLSLHDRAQSVAFYDALDTAKGPSLGTNFTLASPYVLLAHYQELEWAAGFGVDPDLIRVSVGLESPADLRAIFSRALDAAARTEKATDSGALDGLRVRYNDMVTRNTSGSQ